MGIRDTRRVCFWLRSLGMDARRPSGLAPSAPAGRCRPRGREVGGRLPPPTPPTPRRAGGAGPPAGRRPGPAGGRPATEKDAMTLPSPPPRPRLLLAGLAAPLAVVLWAYWPTLAETQRTWATNPQYSHGYLVPLFALLLLWLRRDRLAAEALAPCWWGLPLVGLPVGLRLAR